MPVSLSAWAPKILLSHRLAHYMYTSRTALGRAISRKKGGHSENGGTDDSFYMTPRGVQPQFLFFSFSFFVLVAKLHVYTLHHVVT